MLKRRIAMMGGALLGIGCGGGGPLAPGQGGTGPMFDENVSALSAAVTVAAPHVMPTVQAAGAARASSVAVPAASPNGIDYHGGPVIRTPTVFYIWYGGWNNNDAPTILEDLARNIGGSPYFDINASYGDSTGQIANSVVFGGSTRPGYSHGTSLNDGLIEQIVADALTSGSLPISANGVYFVMTSADVTMPGFCTEFCGWHTFAPIAGTTIKFAFVGNPDVCPDACPEQPTSPNGNRAADTMASVVAHELDEAASDPNLNAWFSGSSPEDNENADKCVWYFGQTYQVPIQPVLTTGAAVTIPQPTATANTHLGNRDYLIQTNWLNANGGGCSNGVRQLRVDVTGGGTATVTSQPARVSCGGANCLSYFDPGAAVTLTATVAPGSLFRGWSGCDSVSGQTCYLNMGSNRAVIARAAPVCNQSCYKSCLSSCEKDGGLARICIPECGADCGC